MTDKKFNDCLNRFRSGDNSGFEEIYNEYCQKMYATAMLIARNSAIAEDITSTAFAAMVKQVKSNTVHIDNPDAWVYRVTKNIAYNTLKKEHPENIELKEETLADNSQIIDKDFLIDFYDVLDELSEKLRECAILHYIYNQTYKEIAAKFDVTERVVVHYFEDIKAHLKKHFGKDRYNKFLSFFM